MTATPGHGDRAHAALGASNSSIWLNCFGSYNLSRNRERKGTVYTREGTAAHEVSEMLIEFRQRGIVSSVPRQVEVEGVTVEVPQEMVQNVGLYVDTAISYIETSVWHGVEVRVRLDELWNHIAPLPLFGTADCIALGEDGTLTVCDLKYGKGKMVAAEGNSQLLYYGLGAYYALPKELRVIVQDVQLVIVQPRGGKEKVKCWTIALVDLLLWADTVLKPAVDAIANGDTSLNAGNHCFFCVAAPVCPKLHEAKIQRAVEAFPDIADTDGEAA